MNNKVIIGISSSSAVLFLLLCIKFSKVWRNPTNKKGRKCKKVLLRSSTPTITEDDIWNSAFFFPNYFPEHEDNLEIRQLIWYMDQATCTIDVCVYGFSFRMLQDALVSVARDKGVRIRVLTNKYIQCDRQLRAAGVHTRTKIHIKTNDWDRSQYVDLLHHKFVVIDSFAAMTGSLNWTMSAITENKENVVVTTNAIIVDKFSREYERLWDESCPTKRRRQIPNQAKRPVK